MLGEPLIDSLLTDDVVVVALVESDVVADGVDVFVVGELADVAVVESDMLVIFGAIVLVVVGGGTAEHHFHVELGVGALASYTYATAPRTARFMVRRPGRITDC